MQQSDLDYGFTAQDEEELMDSFEEAMSVANLYDQFVKVLDNQVSWTKWHIMERKGVSYSVAERILLRAVEEGKVKPEDYYSRFVVIN